MSKVIISCAVTGSAHTPSMSEALPITPAEIAEQSIAAAEAGAAILHLHARIPETGMPTGDPEVFRETGARDFHDAGTELPEQRDENADREERLEDGDDGLLHWESGPAGWEVGRRPGRAPSALNLTNPAASQVRGGAQISLSRRLFARRRCRGASGGRRV